MLNARRPYSIYIGSLLYYLIPAECSTFKDLLFPRLFLEDGFLKTRAPGIGWMSGSSTLHQCDEHSALTELFISQKMISDQRLIHRYGNNSPYTSPFLVMQGEKSYSYNTDPIGESYTDDIFKDRFHIGSTLLIKGPIPLNDSTSDDDLYYGFSHVTLIEQWLDRLYTYNPH